MCVYIYICIYHTVKDNNDVRMNEQIALTL